MEIEESDYFIQYRYLKKKMNHEGQLYNRAQKTYESTSSLQPPSYYLYRNI